MSFSAEIKNELCQLPTDPNCRKALCYGMLRFARSFSDRSMVIVTEHPGFAHLAASVLAEECGVVVDLQTKITHRKQTPESCTVQIEGDDQRGRVLHHFGHDRTEVHGRINRENLQKPGCASAFLRGAFLACGTVINPEKEYHLEFSVVHMHLAEDLSQLLSEVIEMHTMPAIIQRKGSYVVYLKESEAIADLLTYLGAQNGSLELMQVKMVKELRNDVNRRSNCETANIMKTANAAAVQRIAIERIQKHLGLEHLSPELRELCVLRYENPGMSLRELGENLSEPISRSGVNHRLRRILEIAEALPPLEAESDSPDD
ncbi:MAG: DNA-binding protein WhiA [Oscillospiraceae bacterium]|nr:DNA-binding protein WhiA [Oscillospiraceae bacterium]